MDFQFITDLDLLFPIASLVLAAVTALLIGGFIPHKRAVSSSHSECGHTKDDKAMEKVTATQTYKVAKVAED
ncbi:hypothetical protein LSCM4_05790 [Leishmania orientalis]|uniref:Uncharacterized protein n=1 Tax=Leishmania orientalis TaxID=2249476 RepID=A0A836KNN1_9TRYP|nr:hypothetical protein LSCM4_05790 [Leishmania orientalis]